MNNKFSLITILTMLVCTGCDDMFSKYSFEKYDYSMEPPEWVEIFYLVVQILIY